MLFSKIYKNLLKLFPKNNQTDYLQKKFIIMNHNRIDLNDFEMLDIIGKGNFGCVRLVKMKKTGKIYAAKFITSPIFDKSSNVLREINILAKTNHPAIVKYMGVSITNLEGDRNPVIITEYLSNKSLQGILDLERKSKAPRGWNDTIKLCIIYGIASAMSYLHQHGIIHRDLKPDNILLDEYLFPKICDFGLSKDQNNDIQSTLSQKGTPKYMAPEVIDDCQYSEACDVYAFSIIVYELITGLIPYPDSKKGFDIYKKVVKNERPKIPSSTSKIYKDLIKQCWSQDPLLRPTFDEIIEKLTDIKFITKNINENDFLNYVRRIDSSKKSFDDKYQEITFDEIKPICLYPKGNFKIFSSKEYEKLNEKCQSFVDEAQTDADKQFIVGKSLIEGKNGFRKNIQKGIDYIKQSIDGESIEAVEYYCRMLISGDIIPEDYEAAKEIIIKFLNTENATIFLLFGLVSLKEKNYKTASKYLKKASTGGNGEAMYELASLYKTGKGFEKNEEMANKYLKLSKKAGYDHGKLTAFDLYKKGQELEDIDFDQALKYFKRAANKGYDEALIKLGKIYFEGQKVKVDYLTALQYFQRAADKGNEKAQELLEVTITRNTKENADNGDSSAMYQYGYFLENGIGVQMNLKKAAQYYKKSADKNNVDGMLSYGRILKNKKNLTKEELKEAIKYFKMAVDEGNDESQEELNDAKSKLNKFVKPHKIDDDDSDSDKDDDSDSDKDDDSDSDKDDDSDSDKDNDDDDDDDDYDDEIYRIRNECFIKARKYEFVNSQYKKACIYYKKSADKGDPRGMANYGRMLYFGKGCEIDKPKALKYFKMSVLRGHPAGMCFYATMLEKGESVKKDLKKAAHYYKKAAELNYIRALFEYARILKHGIGISPNPKKAKEYEKKANELQNKTNQRKGSRIDDDDDDESEEETENDDEKEEETENDDEIEEETENEDIFNKVVRPKDCHLLLERKIHK